jgi:uncharacterized membrane protein YdcZ (DUF606 family)
MTAALSAFSYLLVVGAGVSVALQQVLNANLRSEIGSPWWAGFISYFVGMLVMIFTRSGGHLSKLGMIRAEVKDGSESADIHG